MIAQLESVLLDTGGSALPIPISEMHNALSEAHTAFETCRYRELGGMLPALVDVARASRAAASGTERDRLSMVLSEAYRLASELCVKLNEDGEDAYPGVGRGVVERQRRWTGVAERLPVEPGFTPEWPLVHGVDPQRGEGADALVRGGERRGQRRVEVNLVAVGGD